MDLPLPFSNQGANSWLHKLSYFSMLYNDGQNMQTFLFLFEHLYIVE